ncbi:hypothetical protein P7M03_16705 [Vibrio parahaemolyticus]|nr:hypothetical protein [Vibrio parahaemolyticus]
MIQVLNANNPRKALTIKDGLTCIAKPVGVYMEIPAGSNNISGDWVLTGETYEPPKNKIYVTVVHRTSKHTKDIYADNKEELCKKLIEPAKNDYFAKNSYPDKYNTINLYGGGYHHGIIHSLESEDSSYWNKAYCNFKYYDSYTDSATLTKSVVIYDIASYTPPTDANEPCPSGQTRDPDTLQCAMPERVKNDKCESGIEKEFSPIKINPLSNVSQGGCHLEKVSVSFAAHNLPKKCVKAKYVSTGKLAREDDYIYKASDYCAADEAPSCIDGFEYYDDHGKCYSNDGTYKSYNPSLIDEDTYEPEKLIEGATDLPQKREEEEAEQQYKPSENEGIKCEQVGNEFEKETVCSIVNENGDYVRPASREEYPSDIEISSGICGNGYTGRNCDEEPRLGGSNGGASNGTNDRGTTESVNDNLEGYLGADKVYNIDYDSIGDSTTSDDNEEKPSVDIAQLFKDNKGTLQEVAECPAPSSIVFFEGVEFLGTSIEKEFTLSYENVCDFGNNYKNIYLNILLLLLALDLIRKMRGK